MMVSTRFVAGLRPVGLALLMTMTFAAVSRAEFVAPDSATSPFQAWTRGDANSTYAQWEVFTDAVGTPGNAPDVGSYPASGSPLGSDARLYGNEATAFLTGGANIYSFAGSTDFTVDAPGYGNGAGWNTRYVAQLRTQGELLDLDSLELTYNDGTSDVTVAPNSYQEVFFQSLGGFGGALVDHLFVFDIPGFNPASFMLDFNAVGSSMSLDRVAIDTFTSTSSLAAVPEPAGAILFSLGAGIIAIGLRRRRRKLPTPATATASDC